jgi:hypothetical protein
MNAPVLHRPILRHHVSTIEAAHPIKVLGLLPRGSAAHVFEDDALDFLAEKQVDLGNLLGRPVGIVLVSGLKGREAEEFPRALEAL